LYIKPKVTENGAIDRGSGAVGVAEKKSFNLQIILALQA
jgi:hypothetical protein